MIKISVVGRFRFWLFSRNSLQGAKSVVMQTSIVLDQISVGEGAEVSGGGGHLLVGFYLGYFVWEEVDPKNVCTHAGRLKNFFRTSRGVLGHVHLEKFEKISVQDWLKSHFWTLVTFTDSLI